MFLQIVLILSPVACQQDKPPNVTEVIQYAIKTVATLLPYKKQKAIALLFLRKGMTEKEVNFLIGRSEAAWFIGGLDCWFATYHDAGVRILFIDNRVSSWDPLE